MTHFVVGSVTITAIVLFITAFILMLPKHKKRLLSSNTIHSYLKETDFSISTHYSVHGIDTDLLYGLGRAEIDSMSVGRPVAAGKNVDQLNKPANQAAQQVSHDRVMPFDNRNVGMNRDKTESPSSIAMKHIDSKYSTQAKRQQQGDSPWIRTQMNIQSALTDAGDLVPEFITKGRVNRPPQRSEKTKRKRKRRRYTKTGSDHRM